MSRTGIMFLAVALSLAATNAARAEVGGVTPAPREKVTAAPLDARPVSGAQTPSPLTGVWIDKKNGLVISIEAASDGVYVMRQALLDDKYSYVDEIIGEFEAQAGGDSFTGRHLWGGWRTGDAEWGVDGGMRVKRINSRQIFVQYLDSKYQGGWTYDKIN